MTYFRLIIKNTVKSAFTTFANAIESIIKNKKRNHQNKNQRLYLDQN